MPSTHPSPATSPLAESEQHTIAWLQRLLDDSYARGGQHMLGIHTDRARVRAEDVVDRLPSMHVMVVATVSSDGRPFTGPVDAFLHDGRVHFGTAPNALRALHLARRPQVSVTYVEGEAFVLTVHGRARPVDLAGRDAAFAARLRAHYGPGWDDFGLGSPYYAVEPDRVLAADMTAHTSG
jgi:hypothetical protein